MAFTHLPGKYVRRLCSGFCEAAVRNFCFCFAVFFSRHTSTFKAFKYTTFACSFAVACLSVRCVLSRWRYRKLPGPPPSWLFGNLRELVKLGNHNAYTQWYHKYGPVYKVQAPL